MTDDSIAAALAAFDRAIATQTSPDAPYKALQALTEAVVGVKLFTIMTVDMQTELASRSFSSDPENYPVSGTKPIHYDAWFEVVHKARQPFVANTIGEIAKVFGDHELIWRLGCGSVINLPIIIGDVLVGTMNILHEEQFYTPERVRLTVERLSLPAKLAYLAAERLKD